MRSITLFTSSTLGRVRLSSDDIPRNTMISHKLKRTITKDQLDTAALAVQGELARAGFWNEGGRLLRCEVYWCARPQFVAADAHGFFFHETSWLSRFQGYEVGHIYIPRWVLAEGFWQKRGSLRDVVRHEYGHALAHYYPALVRRSSRFREVFGDRYDSGPSASESGRPHPDFVSEYAQTMPMEDFAETFMHYLSHGGQRPEQFSSRAIQRKWKFISDLAKTIDSGRCTW